MDSVIPVVAGGLLALVTWLALLAILSLTGIVICSLFSRSTVGLLGSLSIRRSMWWGLAFFTILVLAASLVTPLGGATAALFVWIVLIISSVMGALVVRGDFRRRVVELTVLRSRVWILSAIFIVVIGYFAVAALGPANNYDTGLYHLGAIGYASDFGTLPGVANLYFPFGYANSHFAMAGWLSSTPWGLEGYRLLNGLVIALALADLLARWARRAVTPGTWALSIGLTVAAFPLVSIADFWVTSPTSDSAVLVLSIVASAYLVDALVRRDPSDAGVSLILVALMVAMRPTMIVFAIVVVLVAFLVTMKSRGHPDAWSMVPRVAVAAGFAAAALGGLQLARDRMLSGWLVYPLSVMPVGVPWRAPDPTPFRDATLAAARDPSAPDQFAVAHSWEWIGPWFVARWQMWETYMLLGLLVLGALTWWLVKPPKPRLRRHVLAALWFPSGAAALAWFLVSPPSYRFAWGPLVVFAIAPLAATLADYQLGSGRLETVSRWIPRACALVTLGLVLIAFTSRTDYGSMTDERVWSLGVVSIPYVVSPPPPVETSRVLTEGGVEVLIPVEGDQCWGVYPLCSPLPPASLGFLGADLPSGFTP